MTAPKKPFDFVVIGLGHQSLDDHIPAILDSDSVRLVGVIDTDQQKAGEVAKTHNVPFATSIDTFLESSPKPDAAIVAIPHSGYLEVVTHLAKLKIHILKEKPLAISLSDAFKMKQVVEASNVLLSLTLQRRYNPIFRSFPQLLKRIGRVFSIEGKYVLNVERLDEGWRASRLYSGGGAIIDLGYHYIDLLVWFFGLPDEITCRTSIGNREGQCYDVEDTAFISFSYNQDGMADPVLGSLVVSRVYGEKEEYLVAHGTKGMARVQRGKVERRDIRGKIIESMERSHAWPSALSDQIENFAILVAKGDGNYSFGSHYIEQVAFIEAAYESARVGEPVNPKSLIGLVNEQLK